MSNNQSQDKKQYENRQRRNVVDVHSRKSYIIRKKIPKNYQLLQTRQQQQSVLPFNPINKLLTSKFIEDVLKGFGIDYKVNNLDLFQESFIHKSYLVDNYNEAEHKLSNYPIPLGINTKGVDPLIKKAIGKMLDENYVKKDYNFSEMIPLQTVCNERLEMVGDAVLGDVVTNYLFERYPDQDEGFMTYLKTNIVKGSTLAGFAQKLGLNEYIIISKFIEDSCNGRKNEKFLEDLFESFLGALFRDSNKDYKLFEKLIYGILERPGYIDFADIIENNVNFKDQLLRYYQQNYDGVFPIYKEVVTTIGNNGVKRFTMSVLSPDRTKVVGMGVDRKKLGAEQQASKQALIFYNVLIPD